MPGYNQGYGGGNFGGTTYAPPPAYPMGRHGGHAQSMPDVYGGSGYNDMAMSRHGRDRDRSRSKHGGRSSNRHRRRGDSSDSESSQSNSGSSNDSLDSVSTGASSLTSRVSSRYKPSKSRSRHGRSSKYSDSESESLSDSEPESDDDRRRKSRSSRDKSRSRDKNRSKHSGPRGKGDNLITSTRGVHALYGAVRGIRGKKEGGISAYLDIATGFAGIINKFVGGGGIGKSNKKHGSSKRRAGSSRSRR